MKNHDEIGIAETMSILGISRSSAYIKMRSGEIAGARLVGGLVWVAPRRSVAAHARRNAPPSAV